MIPAGTKVRVRALFRRAAIRWRRGMSAVGSWKVIGGAGAFRCFSRCGSDRAPRRAVRAVFREATAHVEHRDPLGGGGLRGHRKGATA